MAAWTSHQRKTGSVHTAEPDLCYLPEPSPRGPSQAQHDAALRKVHMPQSRYFPLSVIFWLAWGCGNNSNGNATVGTTNTNGTGANTTNAAASTMAGPPRGGTSTSTSTGATGSSNGTAAGATNVGAGGASGTSTGDSSSTGGATGGTGGDSSQSTTGQAGTGGTGSSMPRTECPMAPPAMAKDPAADRSLAVSKDEYAQMLTKEAPFQGTRGQLPWHLYTPPQAAENP